MSDMKYACDENGNVLAPGMLRTPQNEFESWGTISVAASTLGVAERTWAWVNSVSNLATSKRILKSANIGWNHLELQFSILASSGSDDDVHVVEIYGARGENNFHRITTLTLIRGTQTATSTTVFFDTMADNDTTKWLNPSTTYILSPSGNEVARFVFDTFGYTKLLFIATTLVSTGLVVEGAWF